MHIRGMMRRSLLRPSLPKPFQDAAIVQHSHTIGDNNESRDGDRAHRSIRDGSSCQRLSPIPPEGLLHMRLHELGDPCLKENEKLHGHCVICAESFHANEVVCRLPCCGQFFHSKCIVKWLSQKCSCPMCRQLADAMTTDVPHHLLSPKLRSSIKHNRNHVFRDDCNFDLIMRRVLRAEEGRSEQPQDGNEHSLIDTVEEAFPQGCNHIESVKSPAAYSITCRTSFSGIIPISDDWLTDDLELYMLNDIEE